ncbi:type VI secretion system membrane subunit TssM [Paralimibaculum aggregatum]|uniref:Type VI secretion system membrane subunit TssM n=1 Tax=Paralimibaculum aggregatum TaxID=3036245 RepID=A0ABQ6LMT7_9RHOB|nr:type VI secretion system membrane subunit TssM [Limibaculum sp. NKW23]GMG81595.1 type VI secretion system membrane subunit TssM [Limibaculum sp. NKW23]
MNIFSNILFVFERFMRSTVGLVLLFGGAMIAVIWMFGPMLTIDEWRPLDTELSRLIAIGIFVVILIITLIVVFWLRRRRERNLEEDIAKQPAEAVAEIDPSDEAAKGEIAELQGRMKQALGILRKSKLGGKGGARALYQLPWYIIIGPPGAGKTTAIVNSGLKFPLADKMGKAAVVGVGGTRNCDWWFTNEAVLIDTAGRYTTQESDEAQDSKSWIGFLDLLKKNRKRQPINGAMVAISLSDLSLQDEQTRRNHALAIRTRLRELREKLGVRFPVYVLFTKADLMAGFAEFYDRLSKEEREQVWGFTLPLEKKDAEGTPLRSFDQEFDALLARLNDRTIELLQQEVDHRRRSLIYGFSQQVESLRGVAKEFLGEVFQDSAFEDRQLVRGVYFTSGTQEGTPIDRLMRGMAQAFGIGRQAVGTGQGQGKSYFLTTLLSDVIFGEAGLVSADDKVERRYKWIFRGAVTAGILVAGVFGALWTMSYLGNDELLAMSRSDIERYQEAVAGIQINPVEDIDVASVVPALNILRDMPGNPTVNDPEPPLELTWGLYQGDAIGTESAQSYRAGLNKLLLPRLLLRLEKQMESNINASDLIYEGLKVYLTLGLRAPSVDKEMVQRWMLADWSLAFPGPANAQLREDLMVHLTALMDQPMQELPLNGNLVELVQQRLADRPLAERIYKAIISSPAAKQVPDWRITDAGGPQTTRVLIRPSGDPLSEGVEGIYTYKGWTEVFVGEALKVADRMRREAWVLGEIGAAELDEDALGRLTRDVLNLYYDDYVNRWDQVLADIDIIPPASINDAVRITNILSGANSPIKNILEDAARQTELTRKPGSPSLLDGGGEAIDTAATVVEQNFFASFDAQTAAILGALSSSSSPGGSGSAEAPPPPGQYVEEQFAWLRDLAAPPGPGVPSRVDDLLQKISDVNNELNQMSRGSGLTPAAEGGAVIELKETAQEPEFDQGPLKRWAMQVVNATGGFAAGTTRDALNKRWQATVLPFCEKTMNGRYPFARTSRSDMALQDFGKLFGPGGMIDSFFTKNLLEYVDTTSKPWRWKRVGGADLGISAAVLTQFQHAGDIRDSFFLGAGLPKVTFDLKPFALDSKATSVTLEVEGQQLEYAHEVPQVTPMTWPGSAGGRTRIAFTPQLPSAENSMSQEGPWAWFRLLDSAEVRRTNVSDRSRVVFNIGGRIAVFQLRAGSALNPFSLPAMRSFRCVKSL